MQLAFAFEHPRRQEARPAKKIPSRRPPRALERLGRAVLRSLRRRDLTRLGSFRVVWNDRLRTSLGRADYRTVTVELNPRLLNRHPAELIPTLVHELCHLAAGVKARHGPKWKALMLASGFAPTVCHRLDLSHLGNRTRRRRYLWLCRRCGHAYPRTRPDARRYRCGQCGGGLRVVEARIADRLGGPPLTSA